MTTPELTRYPTPLPVPFSKAVRAGDMLYLSGVLAMDAQGQIIGNGVQESSASFARQFSPGFECGMSVTDRTTYPGTVNG